MYHVYYVYAIQSNVKHWVYIGLTKDVNNRVERHNSGRERTTKSYRPFQLIFVQEYSDRKSARDAEKYLKIRNNKESLLELIAGMAELADAQS